MKDESILMKKQLMKAFGTAIEFGGYGAGAGGLMSLVSVAGGAPTYAFFVVTAMGGVLGTAFGVLSD